MRNWKPEDVFDVACPSCGADIEFWKDEPFRSCSACSMEVRNPKVDFGCAKWCVYAEQCVGPDEALAARGALMRDRLVAEMKAAYKGKEPRIDDALRMLEHAERLLAAEGGDPLVVRAAALLRHIGDQDPPVAAHTVLERLGVDAEAGARVCRLIESLHGATPMDTVEARVLRDAQRLARLFAGHEGTLRGEALPGGAAAFETQTGHEMAGKRFPPS